MRRTLICLMILCTTCLGLNMAPFQWNQNILFLKKKEISNVPLVFSLLDDDDSKYPLRIEQDSSYPSPLYELLPLLPEDAPAFTGSRHLLFINEMKFREMFSEMLLKKNQRLVRCYVENDGSVAQFAVICRILENRNLVTGESLYVIKAEERVMIGKKVFLLFNYLFVYNNHDQDSCYLHIFLFISTRREINTTTT